MSYKPGLAWDGDLSAAVDFAISFVDADRLGGTSRPQGPGEREADFAQRISGLGYFARLDPEVRFGRLAIKDLDFDLSAMEEPPSIHDEASMLNVLDPTLPFHEWLGNVAEKRLDWLKAIKGRVSAEIKVIEQLQHSLRNPRDREPEHKHEKGRHGRPGLSSLWVFCLLVDHYFGLSSGGALEAVYRLARALHLTEQGFGQFRKWHNKNVNKASMAEWLDRMGIAFDDDEAVPTMTITFPIRAPFPSRHEL